MVNFIHHLKSLPPQSLPSLLSFNAFTMHANSGKYVIQPGMQFIHVPCKHIPSSCKPSKCCLQKWDQNLYVYSYERFKLMSFTILTPFQMLT